MQSTSTSELTVAISSTDHGLALATAPHEVLEGPCGSEAARRQRDGQQPLARQIELGLDSAGAVAASIAARPMPLAEH
eukprot:9500965-Pyramimonas_sp.AAC.1